MKKFNILNFFILTVNNIYNSTFSTLFIIIFICLKDYTQAANIALLGSFCTLITKSLSINLRNILIINQKKINFYILFRFFFALTIFIFCILFIIFFKGNNYILILFSLIIFSQWINELILIKFETQKKKLLNYIQFFCNLGFLTAFFFGWQIFSDKKIIIFSILLYCFYLNLHPIFVIFSSFRKLNYKNFKKELNLIFVSNSFFSSFSLNFANLFWRLIIFYLVEEKLSSVIFAFYSLGSFPGTLFNNSFGPSMVKKTYSKNYLYLFFLMYLILVFIFSFFILQDFFLFSYYLDFFDNFIYKILFFSLIGSIFMLFAQYFRQKIIYENPQLNNLVFKKDIILSFLLLAIVPLLYLFGSVNYLAYSFFFASLVSFVMYYSKN